MNHVKKTRIKSDSALNLEGKRVSKDFKYSGKFRFLRPNIYVVFYDSVSYYHYFEKALSIEAVKKGRVKKNGFYYYYYV